MYQPPTSPQPIGGVLDSGFKLFRESFTQVFLLAVAVALVTAPSNSVGPYLVQRDPSAGVLAALAGGGLLLVVAAVALGSAIIARIDGVARGAPLTAGQALAAGLNRTPALLGCAVLIVVALGAGAAVTAAAASLLGVGAGLVVGCAFLVLALVVMIWWLFGPYAVVVERRGPLEALRYSRALVRGHWWRVAGLVTIVGVILTVLYFVLGLVMAVGLVSDPESLAAGVMPWYIQFIVAPLVSGVGAPLGYAMLMSAYYDLKLRHEGGDLAQRIAAAA